MTTTTAKRAALPKLAPLALAAALLAGAHAQAGVKVIPTVGATETWTDNVYLQGEAQAKGQFVTEATPGMIVTADGPRLKLAASAQLHLFAYGDSDLPGTHSVQRQYALDARSTLVDELLYLDAGASAGTQSVSAFGPQLNNNLYALGNREEVHTWRISPALRHRFGPTADASLRYTRDGVDAGPKNAFGSSTGDTLAFDLASGQRWHTLGWGLNVTRQQLDNRLAGHSSSQMAQANLNYRMARQFSLTAAGGYDKYDYAALGGRTAGKNWSVGFGWTPSQRTSVQASIGRRYFGKTGSLAATHRSRHTVWSINYSDMVTTSRQQFLLPATIDTATMLDQLFAPTISDPAARQQAVAAYMLATGLPASLADNINYFSNRYMRQKQLQAAAAFTGAHSDLVVSVFDGARTALSVQQSDSALLGASLLALNDDTRQRGVNAIMNYRLSSRTTAQAGLTASRTRSVSTGFTSNNQMLRAGLSRQFSHKLRGAAELRHVRGTLDARTGLRYRENAVSASLTMQF